MESMRQSWTDERLDDLNHRIDGGFDRVDSDIRAQRLETRTEFTALRGEMSAEFAAVRAEMKAGFEKMDARFEATHRLMIQFFFVLMVTVIAQRFL